MASRFSDRVGGFISLRLRGQYQEKIINLALARGIYIWDIKRDGEYLYLKVRNSGYEAFKAITEEHGFELEILKRDGLPFYRKNSETSYWITGRGNSVHCCAIFSLLVCMVRRGQRQSKG